MRNEYFYVIVDMTEMRIGQSSDAYSSPMTYWLRSCAEDECVAIKSKYRYWKDIEENILKNKNMEVREVLLSELHKLVLPLDEKDNQNNQDDYLYALWDVNQFPSLYMYLPLFFSKEIADGCLNTHNRSYKYAEIKKIYKVHFFALLERSRIIMDKNTKGQKEYPFSDNPNKTDKMKNITNEEIEKKCDEYCKGMSIAESVGEIPNAFIDGAKWMRELLVGGQKTLTNTTASQAKDNVKDIVIWGNGDMFKLLCKASSVNERWMKSTKAMEIEGVGCVVQVTTQQGDNVSEALTFVPNVKIEESKDENDKVISRKLVQINS
jgi:hypothetical protein